jgi:hypothetical protein
MRLSYFPNQTALQSEPVWRAFLQGAVLNGITPVEHDLTADAAVIWSVLWHGRMKYNKRVYDHFIQQGKPVFIIEVGALKRGITWKVAVNHIDSSGIYGNFDDQDLSRPLKLGISLQDPATFADSVLIALQHTQSLQWATQPSTNLWLFKKIRQVREYHDCPIFIRPHPRSLISPPVERNVFVQLPTKIPNSYDCYDLKFNHKLLINHNSGPGIQAALAGIPVECDSSSLAHPVSSSIENPMVQDRSKWLIDICHTEWTIEEIAQGIPQSRLLSHLNAK